MPTVTITLGAAANGGGYSPGSQAASPDKVSISIGGGPQTVTVNLVVAPDAPANTVMWFTQNADGWGNVAPISFKAITASDVQFPNGWNANRQAAFLASLQTAINAVAITSPANSPSTATFTITPSTLEAGNSMEINLPYTVNYWINVQGVSWGPNRFDPEVDITPGSR